MMNESNDPILQALAQYTAAVYAKDLDAFLAIYDADVHVFDMWDGWQLRGIAAWRDMAAGWFSSLGTERVVVSAGDVVSTATGDLAVGYATLTFKAVSAEGVELRSLDNRVTLALRRTDGVWKIFHEHTSAPIDHKSLKATIKRDSAA
jgi:ketosteroid isomerase-like protein